MDASQRGQENLKTEAEESTELGVANQRGQKQLIAKAEQPLRGNA